MNLHHIIIIIIHGKDVSFHGISDRVNALI